MNKIKKNVWGRSFELTVIFQIFGKKEPTNIQQQALKAFESMTIDEASLEATKEYIIKKDGIENNIESIDNIFKYVIPKTVFVPKRKEEVIAIMCDYRFDPEHGIAVVFRNGRYSEVGMQDIVL